MAETVVTTISITAVSWSMLIAQCAWKPPDRNQVKISVVRGAP
jgi:hypothetical protein